MFQDMMVSGDQLASSLPQQDSFVPTEERFNTADLVLEQKQQFSKSSPVLPMLLGVLNGVGISYVQKFATAHNLHKNGMFKVKDCLLNMLINTFMLSFFFSSSHSLYSMQ
jgi:hypothetical protein